MYNVHYITRVRICSGFSVQWALASQNDDLFGNANHFGFLWDSWYNGQMFIIVDKFFTAPPPPWAPMSLQVTYTYFHIIHFLEGFWRFLFSMIQCFSWILCVGSIIHTLYINTTIFTILYFFPKKQLAIQDWIHMLNESGWMENYLR